MGHRTPLAALMMLLQLIVATLWDEGEKDNDIGNDNNILENMTFD